MPLKPHHSEPIDCVREACENITVVGVVSNLHVSETEIVEVDFQVANASVATWDFMITVTGLTLPHDDSIGIDIQRHHTGVSPRITVLSLTKSVPPVTPLGTAATAVDRATENILVLGETYRARNDERLFRFFEVHIVHF